MKKLTKREVLGMMAEVAEVKGNEIFMNYIENELSILDRKKSGTSKRDLERKAQNTELANQIIAILTGADNGYTVTEIIKVGNLDATGPKVTSILTSMLKADEPEVQRLSVKGKALYSLV